MLFAVSIPAAVLGAAFLTVAALLQRRGVVGGEGAEDAGQRLGLRRLRGLLRRPAWLAGVAAGVVAVLLQLVSVANAPLIVIQPIGALALVGTAVADARLQRRRLLPAQVVAIAVCLVGISAFVIATATTASDPVITPLRLLTVLGLLAVAVVVLGALVAVRRQRLGPLLAVTGAGIANGFVATIGKVLIRRLEQRDLDWFVLLALVGVVVAGGLAMYLVQTAYAGGSASLVIAGLTVIDPVVAVLLGILVLAEAQGAPVWAPLAYLVAGATAVVGVVQVARTDRAAA